MVRLISPGAWCVAGVVSLTFTAGCAAIDSPRRDTLRARLVAPPSRDGELALAGADQRLDPRRLIGAVLARNPGLEAARHAARAALSRVPRATALEDPMLSYSTAPLSLVSGHRMGHAVELSQRLPFPGKLRLAGDLALSEAEGSGHELEALRLELALLASELFADYYLVERSLALNAESAGLLEDLRATLEAQYRAGRGTQQELLGAELGQAELERERLNLETERAVVVARLNGLLHRAPRAPLPPPPEQLAVAPVDAPGPEAITGRPEHQAYHARIRGREAAVALAERAFLPDFEVMTAYNSMWDVPEHRWMVGLGINLPLWREAREAGVEEAEAELDRARSELQRVETELQVAVEEAQRLVEDSHRVLELYEARLLPAARAQVDAARATYGAGQLPLAGLLDAERALRGVTLQEESARAELTRRQARLARAAGRLPSLETAQRSAP